MSLHSRRRRSPVAAGVSALLLFAAFAVGGCVSGGVGHVAFRQDGVVVPPDLLIPTGRGDVLPARLWLPPDGVPPRAIVVALHGYSDSRDAWEGFGPRLAAHGIALLAPDQRGFGQAPARLHWPGTASLLDDATAVATYAHRRYPDLPLYLLGESMGAAELMVLIGGDDRLARAGVPVAGTVLLAPATAGRGQLNGADLLLLDTADLVAPDWRLTGREVPLHVRASDDRAALLRLARDPLTELATPVSMLSGLVELMTAAQRAAPGLRGPVLIAYGADDQLVPGSVMAHTWARLPPDVRRAYYPYGYHLLLRDRARRQTEDDVLSWIDHPERPLPSGADITAAAWLAGRSWQDGAPLLPATVLGAPFRHDDTADVLGTDEGW